MPGRTSLSGRSLHGVYQSVSFRTVSFLPKIEAHFLVRREVLPIHYTMNATQFLTERFGVSPRSISDVLPERRGILQTTDYEQFELRSDTGDVLVTFLGAKQANRCLPGDHVWWDGEKCHLELRDEHPLLVGTLELTNPTRYGLTSRKVPLYLFTPYDERYPKMIVGSTEKDKSRNRVGVVQFENWTTVSPFPRGLLQNVWGISGDIETEKRALLHQVCPWKYPKIPFHPTLQHRSERQTLTGYTFHIDPEGCNDVDDIFTMERVDDTIWKITITISDVSAYVEEGGAVDIMASLISQTVYSATGQVIHAMLPREYSEGVCSLLPGKDSLGVSLQFLWDGATISNPYWFLSQVRTDATFTYEEFQESTTTVRKVLQEVASHMAGEWIEDAHGWVEQMMIYYNKEAGAKLKEVGYGILRSHVAPDPSQWEAYQAHLPEWKHLAMSSAVYVLAEEKETHHYGLQTDSYAHTTSPIRRYADLVNQRLLKEIITKTYTGFYVVPVTMYDLNRREKAIKAFAREMTFLEAVAMGKTRVRARIIGKSEEVRDGQKEWKVSFYVPDWKKRISSYYKRYSDTEVWSRDETSVISVEDFKEVEMECSIQWSQRHWKRRMIVQLHPLSHV
jgi:exoribonuclease R